MYTLADASRLLGNVEVRSLNRWLYGYSRPNGQDASTPRRRSEPLWHPQYEPALYGEKVIGFHDLMEVRIVREFVRAGLHLVVVRKCLERARIAFGTQYPLSTLRFVTDGETILHEARQAANEEDDGKLLDLRSMQYKFKAIIKPSLYAGIEYLGTRARRWHPDGPRSPIIIDPTVNFGHPIIRGKGIPTETLYASFLAEDKDRHRVARLYEVTPQEVAAAVKYEGKLLRAA